MINSGGLVFPVADITCVDRGLTKRDYFAGQALPEAIKAAYEICDGADCSKDDFDWLQYAAKLSYKAADFMIAERQEGDTK
jgi:hypothetical protein